jgi:hypothetical protein
MTPPLGTLHAFGARVAAFRRGVAVHGVQVVFA